MNPISKSHKRFSEFLNSRVLTNPKEFLGPNYKEVLNFWLFLDDLSEEQLRVVEERYDAFFRETCSEYYKATDLAYDASEGVVGDDYADDTSRAVGEVIKCWAACWATLELIAMHKILENRQKPLTFFPMFLEVL